MSDITLANLNMLYVRYGAGLDRERHVPLGPLYLARILEEEGFAVDFRDFQDVTADDPFAMETIADFLDDPSPVVGISVMANLLPFAVLAIRARKVSGQFLARSREH